MSHARSSLQEMPRIEVEDPASKRRRISRACDQCRNKKTKCDGRHPICAQCSSADLRCSYGSKTKKRGLPTGYVRIIEALWALVFKKVPGSEEVTRRLLEGARIDLAEEGQLLQAGRGDESPAALRAAWWKSSVCHEIERIISAQEVDVIDTQVKAGEAQGESQTATRERPLTPLSVTEWRFPVAKLPETGPSRQADDFSPPLPTPNPPSSGMETDSIRDLRTLCSIVQADNTTQDCVGTQALSSSLLSTFAIPFNTGRLLDIYFTYTHCTFPIVERHDVFRLSYPSATAEAESPGGFAAMWAILAYASFQEAAIASNNEPPTISTDAEWTPDQIYDKARSLIPSEAAGYEVGHVQALLLLALVNFGREAWKPSWFLVGQAVRIATDMQLDRHSPGQHRKDLVQGGIERNTFLGCFVLDTLVAARLGRRPQLRTDDIRTIGLLEENGPEEWDPWVGCIASSDHQNRPSMHRIPLRALSIFNQYVGLSTILNDILCDTAEQRLNSALYDARAEALLSWFKGLPQQCQLYEVSTVSAGWDPQQSVHLPQQFNLHLMYLSSVAIFESINGPLSSHQPAPDLQHSSNLPDQILRLLSTFSHTFGDFATPPTFNLPIHVAYQGLDSKSTSGAKETRAKFDQIMTSFSSVWLGRRHISPSSLGENYQGHLLKNPDGMVRHSGPDDSYGNYDLLLPHFWPIRNCGTWIDQELGRLLQRLIPSSFRQ